MLLKKHLKWFAVFQTLWCIVALSLIVVVCFDHSIVFTPMAFHHWDIAHYMDIQPDSGVDMHILTCVLGHHEIPLEIAGYLESNPNGLPISIENIYALTRVYTLQKIIFWIGILPLAVTASHIYAPAFDDVTKINWFRRIYNIFIVVGWLYLTIYFFYVIPIIGFLFFVLGLMMCVLPKR